MATIPGLQPTLTSPRPAWEVALLFPSQGEWSENDYLALDTNRLVELVDGNLEVLPMPTIPHQLIVKFLFVTLQGFVETRKLGTILFAPLPMRIRPKTMREPDLIYIAAERFKRMGEKYLNGADLVMEVVSEDSESQKRDYKDKRADYAELGIAEYWIVDPQEQRITVLMLDGGQYCVHGEFAPGQRATSSLLAGFTADVSAVFAAGQNIS
jgi:Uma2 family endonuclease